MKLRTLTLRMEPERHDQLIALAEKLDTSVQEFVIRMVALGVERLEQNVSEAMNMKGKP